jgi:hypothetical protein
MIAKMAVSDFAAWCQIGSSVVMALPIEIN